MLSSSPGEATVSEVYTGEHSCFGRTTATTSDLETVKTTSRCFHVLCLSLFKTSVWLMDVRVLAAFYVDENKKHEHTVTKIVKYKSSGKHLLNKQLWFRL